jgi:hopene-associated glycosyltransferase HpnB
MNILILLTSISLVSWLVMLLFWGNFWRCDQQIEANSTQLEKYPEICAIIPARNEAEVIEKSLKSLLEQKYLGNLKVILIDDQSEDKTAILAENLAQELQQQEKLKIITGKTLPSGWTGKLWAMEQGINYALEKYPDTSYFLFTDADIQHGVETLNQLVTKAETEKLALVSLMVKLRCESFWEKLLIPAFIFFFQKLYPFPWVNNPHRNTAAAAGGCILIRKDTLEEIGGIGILRDALIDDCTLAATVKSPQRPIWLGLTETSISLRPYNSLDTIWDMIARTAYTQLNYSPLLLLGTVIVMSLIYLLPPVALIIGLIVKNPLLVLLSFVTWLLITVTYYPTIKLYKLPFWRAFSLPLNAFLYTLMTIDSGWRHWRGKGGGWKGRTYPQS